MIVGKDCRFSNPTSNALDDHVDTIKSLQVEFPDPGACRDQYRAWLLTSAQAAGIDETRFDLYVSQGLLNMNLAGVGRYFEQMAQS